GSEGARAPRREARADQAGAGERGARPPAQPAPAAAADPRGPDHAPAARRGSDRIVRARDAERAVRSAAAPIGGGGGGARRSDARHAAGPSLVPRRRPRDRRGGRDPGSAGRADRRLKRFAPPAARDERRSVVALDSKLEQQNELLHRVFAASRPQGRDGEELV